MSIEYCEKCNGHIDTDYEENHFDEEVNGCEATFEEEEEEVPQFKGALELLDKLTIIK